MFNTQYSVAEGREKVRKLLVVK